MTNLDIEKKEFLKQYVLNRSLTVNVHMLDSEIATSEAIKAWNKIMKSIGEEQ
jgi:hypothetical protein